MNRPLVVGIDPGTTTAVALMDLNGVVLLVTSRKGFAPAELRALITSYGTPVVVCSDVSPAQKAVLKLAAGFPAQVTSPETIVPRREKKKMLRAFEFRPRLRNDHERDAVCAALLAWRELRPLMEKVDSRLAKLGVGDAAAASTIKVQVLQNKRNITTQIRQFLSTEKKGNI